MRVRERTKDHPEKGDWKVNMAQMRDNYKMGTGSLAVAGLLLSLVSASATAQTYDTPGDDQPGSVSAYLSLGSVADVGTSTTADPNPDPEGRFGWATSYDFGSGLMPHNPEGPNNSADATFRELLPLEGSIGPYMSIAPKEYAGEFNPAYGGRAYDWSDLYDFSGKVAYAISKITTDRNRRIPGDLVAKTPAPVEKESVTDLPEPRSGSASRPGATLLSVLTK